MGKSILVKKPQRMPLSGDKAIDTLLTILIVRFKKEIKAIHLKEVLRDPVNPRQELHGLFMKRKIYLGKRRHKLKNTPLASTLIHELLHRVLPGRHEEYILDRENFMWVRLTDAQKSYLRRYIPKHTVKKEP